VCGSCASYVERAAERRAGPPSLWIRLPAGAVLIIAMFTGFASLFGFPSVLWGVPLFGGGIGAWILAGKRGWWGSDWTGDDDAESQPADAAETPPRRPWWAFVLFLVMAIAAFAIIPALAKIRSWQDAAVAVPLFAGWVWFWATGIKRGWWEGGE
jgi:hypothetical protein